MNAIIESIKQFDKEKDKLSIYKDMKDVLIHNYKVLEYNASKKPPHAFDVVQKIFTEDVTEYERQNKKFI
jgi:hypothetical protein